MKTIRAIIFEKKYEINLKYENIIVWNVINEQLSYYPKFTNAEEADLVINIFNNLSHHNILKKNPSVHIEIEDGFIAVYPTYQVAFYFKNKKLNIDLAIKPSGNFLLASLRKFINIEFATREERIAQTLFEGVIIPSLFFNDKKLIVHSSGFAKKDKGILIGGTGGSGKTSLEIEFCLNRNYIFMNDDIAVVNEKGTLLPNLAHPKIYGYNLVGNQNLKNKLFNSRNYFDKVHWWFTIKIFGASKVRRRLFLKNNLDYTNKGLPLDKYFILSKENVEKISIEKISNNKAASLHLNVILAEYSLFFNHIYWHEFNSIMEDKKPIISYCKLRGKMLINSETIFRNTKNFIVRIPLQIEHSEFLKTTIKTIEEVE